VNEIGTARGTRISGEIMSSSVPVKRSIPR
jgi:hypothetical protein